MVRGRAAAEVFLLPVRPSFLLHVSHVHRFTFFFSAPNELATSGARSNACTFSFIAEALPGASMSKVDDEALESFADGMSMFLDVVSVGAEAIWGRRLELDSAMSGLVDGSFALVSATESASIMLSSSESFRVGSTSSERSDCDEE